MPKARKTRTRRHVADSSKSSIDDLVGYCEPGETISVPESFFDHVFLLYGESGAGKTSMLSRIPGSYIVQCDPNRRGLAVRQTNIPGMSLNQLKQQRGKPTPWDIIAATFDRMLSDDSVRVVIIDNLNLFHQHAEAHYCLKNAVDKLADMNDFGYSWDEVDRMYCDLMSAVVNSGRGLGIITHQREREIALPDGSELVQIQPDLQKRPMSVVRAVTNFAFYLGFGKTGDRVLTIRHQGNDIWYKCCTDETSPRFFYDGKPVHRISAGSSPQQAWDNLMLSWENQMPDIDDATKKDREKRLKRKRG